MGSGTSKNRKGSEKKGGNAKGKLLMQTLTGHTGGINCMDISESGGFLLTGSDDRTGRVWDLVTYESKVVLEGHTGYISCCRVWQERFALTGSVDKTVRKWNMLSGNCILKMELHKGMLNRLLIYGSYLFSSSYDRTMVCWRIESGQPARVFRGHKQSVLPMMYVKTAEHDPKGGEDVDRNKDALISGSMDCTAKIWSINSGTCLRTFRGHKGAILCLAMDKDKKYLYTGSTDFTIKKWNVTNGNMLKSFKGHEGSVICLDIHHKLLYSASIDCTARCWVAEFGDTTRKYAGHEHMISDMKYYNGLVITGSGDNIVRVFDAKSGTLKRTFKGHKSAINCILPVDNMILSGSYDGSVRIWNIRDLMRERVTVMGSESCSSIASTVSSPLHQSVTPQAHITSSFQEINETDPRHRRELQIAQSNDEAFEMKEMRMSRAEVNELSRNNLKSGNASRQNPKRRGMKTGHNKVVPMRGGVNHKNLNNNNNDKIRNLCDEPDDIDQLLNIELSDANSEGYTSRSSSSATYQEIMETSSEGNANNITSFMPQEETSQHPDAYSESPSNFRPPRKPKRFAEANSESSLLSNVERNPAASSVYRNKMKDRDDLEIQSHSASRTSSATMTSLSLSLPSSSNSSRTSTVVFTKSNSHALEASELSRKRVKTGGSPRQNSGNSTRLSSADLALVDEEIKMISTETDSTSTGYHSDKSALQSPVKRRSPAEVAYKAVAKSPSKNLKSITDKQAQKMRLASKSSSRSSLWATCSNSVDASGTKMKKTKKETKEVSIHSNVNQYSFNINTRNEMLTPNERERLENEILQMS